MTQQEIWDDTALVQAFNKAINTYKVSPQGSYTIKRRK